MKIVAFILVLISFGYTKVYTQSLGNYARVKVYTDEQGLSQLASLGVTVDHGIHKEGVFFISDFSSSEISIIQSHNYSFEVLIPDVVAYYEQMLASPAEPTSTHNTSFKIQ